MAHERSELALGPLEVLDDRVALCHEGATGCFDQFLAQSKVQGYATFVVLSHDACANFERQVLDGQGRDASGAAYFRVEVTHREAIVVCMSR